MHSDLQIPQRVIELIGSSLQSWLITVQGKIGSMSGSGTGSGLGDGVCEEGM